MVESPNNCLGSTEFDPLQEDIIIVSGFRIERGF